jgi:hypothetical protein
MVMKRFYIKRIADYVTIVHRPTHQVIMMGNMDEEMGKQIKRFINMTTEEFYKELHSLGLKFKTTKNIKEEQDKEKEDWYKSAWSYTTKQVLDHYKIKEDSIPDEDMPLELIEELQRREGTSWDIEPKEEKKEAIEEKEKPKKRTLKKRKKSLKKVSNKKVATLVPYKTKQEIRSAYIGGEIDLETFKKYMKALKS